MKHIIRDELGGITGVYNRPQKFDQSTIQTEEVQENNAELVAFCENLKIQFPQNEE